MFRCVSVFDFRMIDGIDSSVVSVVMLEPRCFPASAVNSCSTCLPQAFTRMGILCCSFLTQSSQESFFILKAVTGSASSLVALLDLLSFPARSRTWHRFRIPGWNKRGGNEQHAARITVGVWTFLSLCWSVTVGLCVGGSCTGSSSSSVGASRRICCACKKTGEGE